MIDPHIRMALSWRRLSLALGELRNGDMPQRLARSEHVAREWLDAERLIVRGAGAEVARA